MFTKQELREELIGAALFLIGFPIVIVGFFAIIPHV